MSWLEYRIGGQTRGIYRQHSARQGDHGEIAAIRGPGWCQAHVRCRCRSIGPPPASRGARYRTCGADQAAKDAVALAQRGVDDLELAVGLADSRGDEAEFARLNTARKGAIEKAAAAVEEVERIALRQRGARTMLADLDKEIVLISASVSAALGEGARLCWTMRAAISEPDLALLEAIRTHAVQQKRSPSVAGHAQHT